MKHEGSGLIPGVVELGEKPLGGGGVFLAQWGGGGGNVGNGMGVGGSSEFLGGPWPAEFNVVPGLFAEGELLEAFGIFAEVTRWCWGGPEPSAVEGLLLAVGVEVGYDVEGVGIKDVASREVGGIGWQDDPGVEGVVGIGE
jgi:hypothetical protein